MSKYDVILDVYENQSISKAAQNTTTHNQLSARLSAIMKKRLVSSCSSVQKRNGSASRDRTHL